MKPIVNPARLGLLAAALFVGALSAQALLAPRPVHAEAAPQPDYHPSLGDLMTMAVQPRHTKLGMAGAARNWTYATYEVSELRNAFNRIARTVPTLNGSEMSVLFNTRIKDQVDGVEAAVKAHDGKRFDTAYAGLTKACNTCHETQMKGFVVIKEPQGAPYPDQDFRPH